MNGAGEHGFEERALAVHHLAVVVRDLERAARFYGGVLRLPVRTRWTDARGAPRSIWFELGGGAFLAVELLADGDADRPDAEVGGGDPPRAGPRAGFHCVALAIEAVERERWRERLREGGAPVERESAFTLYARDPEGNLVGLSHYPDPARDAPT